MRPFGNHLALTLLLTTLASSARIAHAAPSATEESATTTRERYTLRHLIELSHHRYPGVLAAEQSLAAMKGQRTQAKWAWLPKMNLSGLVAPAPEIRCLDATGQPNEQNCIRSTETNLSTLAFKGIYARIQLEIGMPLYTFDKLGALGRTAEAGVALRTAQIDAVKGDLELKLAKAYWGVKLAREIRYTIDEGKGFLQKAQQKIEADLANDNGDSTMIDLLRVKTFAAEIEARELEAKKLEQLTLAAIGTLIAQEPNTFDIDEQIIKPVVEKTGIVENRTGSTSATPYIALAERERAESKMLNAAVRAKRSATELVKAQLFPDFLLLGMISAGIASSIDDPPNAFFYDPFNFAAAGIGLGLSWKIDLLYQIQNYRVAQNELKKVEAEHKEGMAGIALDVRKNHIALEEAKGRLIATEKGQKSARQWLVATSQSHSTGLSEPKEVTDALLAFFQLKLRYLEAMFDVNTGWAELARSIGKHVFELTE